MTDVTLDDVGRVYPGNWRIRSIDPAMLQWLNGIENDRYDPNENYGREMMELFTLGADRAPPTPRTMFASRRGP